MELRQIKGNTWVLESWNLIPLYRLDHTRCILLDTGTLEQRWELETALDQAGLTPVAILGSHAHIDHMGSHGYFQKTRGTRIVMSLGEAGQIASSLGLQLQYYTCPQGHFAAFPELGTAPCVPDRVILPGEETIRLFGADFGILRTPGHTVDHISVRTPDNVLYVADAMMTGRTLHRSKFPFALSITTYLDSLVRLRWQRAAYYIVAHRGVYTDILPFIDLELQFLRQRMLSLLELVGPEGTTPKLLTQAICRRYEAKTKSPWTLAYFEQASQAYLNYLADQGHLKLVMADSQLYYQRVTASPAPAVPLPPTGLFR